MASDLTLACGFAHTFFPIGQTGYMHRASFHDWIPLGMRVAQGVETCTTNVFTTRTSGFMFFYRPCVFMFIFPMCVRVCSCSPPSGPAVASHPFVHLYKD